MHRSDSGDSEPLLSQPTSEPAVLPPPITGTFYPVNNTYEDQPPPYTPTPTTPMTPTFSGSNVTVSSEVPVINCRVCHTMMNIEGRLHLHVIKCQLCGEATPIRPAPVMKKYVRCPCNCLLICKASSQRIVCPRPNCKRVISLGPAPPNENLMEDHSMTTRVICAYCNYPFRWRRPRNSRQKCPNCNRRSFPGETYKRNRTCCSGLIFTAALILSAIMSYLSFNPKINQNQALFFTILAVVYCFSVISFVVCMYYSILKVSRVERVSSLRYT
ncbi:type 1 phosphatidylinositol 4,5-bisphosphate 4-phosphatase-like [Clavelina lepadiformis]|uniref:Phosphatidylinositol-4,5-bisphosphate 4-phosphatase n=1 Tax=Clavelina lepadiformis TaxID=159417 RepID=A0ABP0FHU7_CLALP